jgi:hypothetical protein
MLTHQDMSNLIQCSHARFREAALNNLADQRHFGEGMTIATYTQRLADLWSVYTRITD